MTKHYIDIAGKWAIVFAYDISTLDLDEIADWLDALGASERDIRRACSVILGTNTGFTFSNDKLRMSVMCVSVASSVEQWWDSIAHEADHVQQAILRYYDVPQGTEDAAYLQGYIVRGIVRAITK